MYVCIYVGYQQHVGLPDLWWWGEQNKAAKQLNGGSREVMAEG